ncbi:hypothetical protein ACFQL4_22320 [Halosimplex aquaticum]
MLIVAGAPALGESVASAIERRSFPSPVTSAEVRAAEATDHDQTVDSVACSTCAEALARLESTEESGASSSTTRSRTGRSPTASRRS